MVRVPFLALVLAVVPVGVLAAQSEQAPAPIERIPAENTTPSPSASSQPANTGAPAPVPADLQHFGFDALVQGPVAQSSFTFDRSMLSLADGFVGNSDEETRRVMAGLNSITVHNYHMRDGAEYDPSAFGAIEESFDASHWKHLVNGNSHSGGTLTDLWLRFDGMNIRNVVVLTRSQRDMNFISVDCVLRPLDLLHLSGHFGIPKVDQSAVMVPAH